MNTQTNQVTAAAKGPNALIHELQKEASKNKAFSDVCTVFALRERARAQVTVNSLKATMDSKKYTYSKDDLRHVIARLAALGIGTLHKDSKGRVRALVNVKYTLQSIGLAAVGKQLNLSGFKKPNRFSKVLVNTPLKSPNQIREQFAKTVEESKPVAKHIPGDKTVLVSTINGKTISIPLTDEQFLQFIGQLAK